MKSATCTLHQNRMQLETSSPYITIHVFSFYVTSGKKIEESLTLCGILTKQPRSIPSPFIHLWNEPLHHFTPYSLFTLLCPFYFMSLECVTRSPLSLSLYYWQQLNPNSDLYYPPPSTFHPPSLPNPFIPNQELSAFHDACLQPTIK